MLYFRLWRVRCQMFPDYWWRFVTPEGQSTSIIHFICNPSCQNYHQFSAEKTYWQSHGKHFITRFVWYTLIHWCNQVYEMCMRSICITYDSYWIVKWRIMTCSIIWFACMDWSLQSDLWHLISHPCIWQALIEGLCAMEDLQLVNLSNEEEVPLDASVSW